MLNYCIGLTLDGCIERDIDKFHDNLMFTLVVGGGFALFAAVRGLCFSMLQGYLERWLKDRLMSSLLKQEQAFFDGNPSGELMSRMTSDIN